ncbi:methyltransferase [Marinobacterium aestuarii]|uniref:Putative 4-hydroxy-4-methyl-2-oxoglutarate aldolase n=1 Tax=Marinobacterium aestuarii TaxID=1821621 RepID=A0A1A9F2B6_9GAMM|nr:RraA family protein [Marinobacterium aestuarii]ANG64464.1 methyltransferase [Marinobacterium aestuarii]
MLDVNSNQIWPTGYMIKPMATPVSLNWRSEFASIPSSIISDCLGRNIGALGLKPYHGFKPMCGTALTVRVRPGDNLMILKALQLARPGDVLVIDGGGDLSRAVIGGLMRAMALRAGMTGVVVNGALRDRDEWMEGNLPVYALGCVHRGPSSDGGGEINVPVSCAGMVVTPGDLVVGDADGVVAVGPAELAALYARCQQLLLREEQMRQGIAKDNLDPDRFDALLRQKGCPV